MLSFVIPSVSLAMLNLAMLRIIMTIIIEEEKRFIELTPML